MKVSRKKIIILLYYFFAVVKANLIELTILFLLICWDTELKVVFIFKFGGGGGDLIGRFAVAKLCIYILCLTAG